LHQLRWLLGGALTLLGLAMVAYMDMGAFVLVPLAAGVSIATTFWPRLPARVPHWVNVAAFPLMAAFFALDLWMRSELLPAVIRLDLLLLLYRATVYRQRRDDLQVIVLGLFLVVVAGVLTVSLGFALHLLVYTACALLMLLVLTLLDSVGGAAPAVQVGAGKSGGTPAGGAGVVPAWALHANWPRLARRVLAVADWRVIGLFTILFAGLVAGSALLFLVIPRFQLDNGMFMDRFITKKARTGFTDTIRFGDVTQIQQDNSVALHVDVSDPGQIPNAPYWRMLVLDEYADGTFRMSPALRASRFMPPRTGTVVDGVATFRRNRPTWTFYLEPGLSRYLPLLGYFRQLRFAEAQTYERAPGAGLLALRKEPVTMTAYQVEGFELSVPVRDSSERFFAQERPGGRGELSEADQQVLRRLAAEAGAGGGTGGAADFARRLEASLRAGHAYTLSPRIPAGDGDPLVRWANSREAGHCELFAGSFVLIARAAGYPARVVTGFRGGVWNGYSNSFTIRNSDAHAWAEIYDTDAHAWLRADPLEVPTETKVNETSAAAGVAQRTDRSWSARLDSLRVFWYRRVVSFDQQTQARTLRSAKEAVQDAMHRLHASLDAGVGTIKSWLRGPWNFGRVAIVAVFATVIVVVAWGWGRLRVVVLAWRFRRSPARREDPIRREAGKWLRRLAQPAAVATGERTDDRAHEEVRGEGTPPTGRMQAGGRNVGGGRSTRGDLIADLQRLRFGASQTWPDAASVFRRARAMRRFSPSRKP
jgi:transglutaminase-like putative cysteine protease